MRVRSTQKTAVGAFSDTLVFRWHRNHLCHKISVSYQ